MTKQSEIKDQLRKYFDVMGKVSIKPDGTVDVSGNVEFMGKTKFTQLPVKFGTVTGSFTVIGEGLTTLEGCPTQVGGTFKCMSNNLTSLAHGPTHVGGSYLCGNNKLTNLAHAPTHVPRVFNCANNQLTDLQHAPVQVGDISCQLNPLKSLIGAPEHVEGQWTLTYDEHLPLLRICTGDYVHFVNQIPDSILVSEILEDHLNKGRAGVLTCAVALVKAGFKGNARW
jgi:hypothetical protein